MRGSRLIYLVGLCTALLALRASVQAGTVQTFGAGTAVQRIDRAATFDALNYNTNGTPLSDYAEASLFLRVDGDSWVGDGTIDFDPFHGANGSDRTFEYPDSGSYGWVTIETTDAKKIYAVEFMYGNGWTTGDSTYPWGNPLAYINWQTWANGAMVSSGAIGDGQQWIDMGTIIGFYDPAGWDQLLLQCKDLNSVDPNLQALVLDNVNVQLLEAPPRPGDLNCDGVVNFADIDPFVLALSGQAAYEVQYPDCRWLNADINGDGAVNFADIDPFVACLSHGGCP